MLITGGSRGLGLQMARQPGAEGARVLLAARDRAELDPLMSIDSGRAAAEVIDACRHGDAELIITWPAKLAVIANAVAPDAVALDMNVANRLLPGPIDDRSGDARHSGWQSLSNWAPSKLTTLTERAAAENNELPH